MHFLHRACVVGGSRVVVKVIRFRGTQRERELLEETRRSKRTDRSYTSEFKTPVAELVGRSGKSTGQIEKDLEAHQLLVEHLGRRCLERSRSQT